MIRKFFIYSSIDIGEIQKRDNIALWSDPKPLICKNIPHFAYFKLSSTQNNQVTEFYANDTKIRIDFSKFKSTYPFFDLQEIFQISKEIDGSILLTDDKIPFEKSYSRIQQILNQSISIWFDEFDAHINDSKFFFKIISLNFPFNNFTTNFFIQNEQIIRNVDQTLDTIKIQFKYFILSIRPNGKPNSQPLFNLASFFFIFSHSLNDLMLSHPNFISHGINSILKYLLRDNEWGPCSVISYCASYILNINDISPFPMNPEADFNSEVLFDKRNLSNIKELVSLYGISALIWSYNIFYHNSLIKLAKLLTGKASKISESHLKELIKKKIETQSNLLKFQDFDLFFEFIEQVSKSTNNQIIFTSIANNSFYYKQFCDQKFMHTLHDSSNDEFIISSNENNELPLIQKHFAFNGSLSQPMTSIDFSAIVQKLNSKNQAKEYHVRIHNLRNYNIQRCKSEHSILNLSSNESITEFDKKNKA